VGELEKFVMETQQAKDADESPEAPDDEPRVELEEPSGEQRWEEGSMTWRYGAWEGGGGRWGCWGRGRANDWGRCGVVGERSGGGKSLELWIGGLLKSDGQEGDGELRGDGNEQDEAEDHSPERATPSGIGVG